MVGDRGLPMELATDTIKVITHIGELKTVKCFVEENSVEGDGIDKKASMQSS